jgi:hypothetical protein
VSPVMLMAVQRQTLSGISTKRALRLGSALWNRMRSGPVSSFWSGNRATCRYFRRRQRESPKPNLCEQVERRKTQLGQPHVAGS